MGIAMPWMAALSVPLRLKNAKGKQMPAFLQELYQNFWQHLWWPAWVSGLAIGIMASALGVFVVWRRLAYFGAAVAHSGLLGVALAVILHWPFLLGIWLACLLTALAIYLLGRLNLPLANDGLLGLVAHVNLALGVVLISLLQQPALNIESFLFGDILLIDERTFGITLLLLGVVLLVLSFFWQSWLKITVSQELSIAYGLHFWRQEGLFILLLTTIIAMGMHLVGILLWISLLIIPALTVRPWVSSPFLMLVASALVAMLMISLGLALSFYWDVPSGASIVLFGGGLFFVSVLAAKYRRGKN
jgi:zinc transport system permease protein